MCSAAAAVVLCACYRLRQIGLTCQRSQATTQRGHQRAPVQCDCSAASADPTETLELQAKFAATAVTDADGAIDGVAASAQLPSWTFLLSPSISSADSAILLLHRLPV